MNIETINPVDEYRLLLTRRHFFGRCGLGLGTAALAALLKEDGLAAGPQESLAHVPKEPAPPNESRACPDSKGTGHARGRHFRLK